MKDFDWLVPSAILTLLSVVTALTLIPNYSGIMPALGLLPLWMIAAGVLSAICGFVALLRSGTATPIKHMMRYFTIEWRSVAMLCICILVSGLNMIAFMWTKPLLNYMVPFWADPLLAEVDKALFLGTDPWKLFTWLNLTPTAIFYHRGWFGLMILTLILVTRSSPSIEKTALMLTYFLLWSVVGPAIHILLPAAGPIFFEQLGYGDRFNALEGAPETLRAANYLWTIYSTEGFGPGSGISAMPSMHIATTAWMIMCFYFIARRWLPLMMAMASLIFLLSISLGWHYAADGIVGGGAALLCFYAVRAVFKRTRQSDVASPTMASQAT